MIEFDEANHIYRVDGAVLPSVTQLMSVMGLIRPYTGDPWYGERGTAVHKACELHDLHILDWDTVDEQIKGFVEAYVSFQEETGIICGHAETLLSHPIYRFCGKPDRFVPLIDIKTTDSACVLQLAAYGELLRTNGFDPGRESFFLHLKEDGSYKLVSYRFNRKDTGIFLSACTVWWYRKEKGLL